MKSKNWWTGKKTKLNVAPQSQKRAPRTGEEISIAYAQLAQALGHKQFQLNVSLPQEIQQVQQQIISLAQEGYERSQIDLAEKAAKAAEKVNAPVSESPSDVPPQT